MEDGRLATAGLLARGSSVSFRPSRWPNASRQWHMRKKLAAYSCGSSHGLGALRLTVFPFSSVVHIASTTETVAPLERPNTVTMSMRKPRPHLRPARAIPFCNTHSRYANVANFCHRRRRRRAKTLVQDAKHRAPASSDTRAQRATGKRPIAAQAILLTAVRPASIL